MLGSAESRDIDNSWIFEHIRDLRDQNTATTLPASV